MNWQNWMIKEIIKLKRFDDRLELMNRFIESEEFKDS